jgi:hypothetical protein
MSQATDDPAKITETVMATIINLQADPDDVVRALANVLIWHLRRMPHENAKPALGYVFNLLAANGYMVLTSSNVGHA